MTRVTSTEVVKMVNVPLCEPDSINKYELLLTAIGFLLFHTA